MRRVLACSKCRKHKIKCVHHGKPPCAYCINRGLSEECELSFPEVKSRKKVVDNGKRVPKSDFLKREASPIAPMDAIFTPGIRPALDPKLRIQSMKNNVHVSAQESILDLVPMVPPETVQKVILRTVGAFPEMNFFHLPTVLHNVESLHPILVGAVLAHAAFFEPNKGPNEHENQDKWLGCESFLVSNYIYEKLTLEAIFNDYTFLLRPDLDIARSLLLLSVVKWGHNEYYASWMLHGCAVRMIQSLDFDEAFNARAKKSVLLKKIKERTFWCAFALDRIISTGQNKCFVITEYQEIPLPSADNEFSLLTLELPNESGVLTDDDGREDRSFTIKSFFDPNKRNHLLMKKRPFTSYLIIYAIWGEINGRIMKQDKSAIHLECPWVPSTGLYKISHNLDFFWSSFPEEWKWSPEKFETKGKSNILRKDTTLLTTNCLYHLSLILLNREFLPFLPYDVDEPVGPTDSHSLPSPPTDNYWIEKARIYFQATRDLGSILDIMLTDVQSSQMLSESANAVLVTPFYSFAAFACAIAASYGWNYYWMDPDHEKYTNNINNPRCLPNCYARMVELLREKEDSCYVTKIWLSIAIKFHEINKFVAENRERAKQLDWGKFHSKDMQHSLENLNPDLRRVEKSFPLLPPPYSRQQNSVSKIDSGYTPSNMENYQPSQGFFPMSSGSVSYSQLPFMPSHSGYAPPGYLQGAIPFSSNVATAQGTLSPRQQSFSSQSSQQPFSRQLNLQSNLSSSHQPVYSANPPMAQPLLYPSSISQISQISSNEMPTDLETDKLNLFFNDQELDLLLQFKG